VYLFNLLAASMDVELPDKIRVLELTSREYGSTVNSTLLDMGRGRYILVDTGFPDTWEELSRLIHAEIGAGGRVGRIIITHLHPDHCGGTGKAVETLGAALTYHHDEDYVRHYAEQIMDSRLRWIPDDVKAALRRGLAAVLSTPSPNVHADNGLTFDNSLWRLVHTPGHTPGHLCLFNDGMSILVSGDHLLPDETTNIPYLPIQGYNPLKLYLQSLTRVSGLKPSTVIPSHGKPFQNIQERIAQLFTHHRRRLRETAEAIVSKEREPISIASHITWSRGSFSELSPFDRWLAILETMAHLEFLVSVRYASKDDGSPPTYRPVEPEWDRVENVLNLIRAGGKP